MVSKGFLPGCVVAKEKWPGACQSCVSTTWWNRAARRLTIGTISSPCGTASAPPGQKSFCTSTTMSTSLPSMVAASLISGSRRARSAFARSLSKIWQVCLHFQPVVELRRKFLEFVGDLDRIGRARLEAAQGFGQPFKLALGVAPNVIERRRRAQAAAVLHHELEEGSVAIRRRVHGAAIQCQPVVRHA